MNEIFYGIPQIDENKSRVTTYWLSGIGKFQLSLICYSKTEKRDSDMDTLTSADSVAVYNME